MLSHYLLLLDLPKTTGITTDFGLAPESELSLNRDVRGTCEQILSVRKDSSPNSEARLAIRYDRLFTLENNISARGDIGAFSEQILYVREDAPSNLETTLIAAINEKFTIESNISNLTDISHNQEIGRSVPVSNGANAENRSTVRIDKPVAIESIGVISFIGDAAANLETISLFAATAAAAGEEVANQAILVASRQESSFTVLLNAPGRLEILASVARDNVGIAETRLFVQIDQTAKPEARLSLSWLSSVKQEAGLTARNSAIGEHEFRALVTDNIYSNIESRTLLASIIGPANLEKNFAFSNSILSSQEIVMLSGRSIAGWVEHLWTMRSDKSAGVEKINLQRSNAAHITESTTKFLNSVVSKIEVLQLFQLVTRDAGFVLEWLQTVERDSGIDAAIEIAVILVTIQLYLLMAREATFTLEVPPTTHGVRSMGQMIPRFHVGDSGIAINLLFVQPGGAPLQIGSATTLMIIITRPSGSVVRGHMALVTDGNDGAARYIIGINDLTEPGQYKVQGYVIAGGDLQGFSSTSVFNVDLPVSPSYAILTGSVFENTLGADLSSA